MTLLYVRISYATSLFLYSFRVICGPFCWLPLVQLQRRAFFVVIELKDVLNKKDVITE